MDHHPPLSAIPAIPYQWNESVLSTRSLSYVSHMGDGFDSRGPSSRRPSAFSPPTRKSTLASIDDMTDADVLDMHRTQQSEHGALSRAFGLPETVAQSPLFRLPREIRDVVYSYLLTTRLGIEFPTEHLRRNLCPQLLRVCKTLNTEAAPILYTRNKLIFSHPSDANMFRHAIAEPGCASALPFVIFRIKYSDARLWTAYINSTADERSLRMDFPNLRSLGIQFKGPRFQPNISQEQNALHWLRDTKLQEVILCSRKAVGDVRLQLCVKVPDNWQPAAWETALRRVLVDQETMVGPLPTDDGFTRVSGIWLKLVTEGT